MATPVFESPQRTAFDWALAERLGSGDPLDARDCGQLAAELRWFGRNWGAIETLQQLRQHIAAGRPVDPFSWQGDAVGLRGLRSVLAILLAESLDFAGALALLEADYGLTEDELARDIPLKRRFAPETHHDGCIAEDGLRAAAVLAAALGHLETAAEVLAWMGRSMDAAERIEIDIRRCELHLDLGDPEGALDVLRKSAENDMPLIDPSDELCVRQALLRADISAHYGLYSEAKAQYETLLARDRAEKARARLARLHLELNQLDPARRLLKDALPSLWAEQLRLQVAQRARLTTRRDASSADLMQFAEGDVDIGAESIEKQHDVASAVLTRQSVRLRADVERACQYALRLAAVGRASEAEIILEGCRGMARHCQSRLFDGLIEFVRARCLLAAAPPRPRAALLAADQAMRAFRDAHYLPMAMTTEALQNEIAEEFDLTDVGTELRDRFKQGLSRADRKDYDLTNWTRQDAMIAKLLEHDTVPAAQIAESIRLSLGRQTNTGLRSADLPENTALLALVSTQDSLYPLMLTSQEDWQPCGSSRAVTRQRLAQLVSAFLNILNDRRRPGDDATERIAEQLADILGLRQIVSRLDGAGIIRLDILATGAIGQVPLGLLPLGGGRRLMDRFVLGHALFSDGTRPRKRRSRMHWLGLSNEAGNLTMPALTGANALLAHGLAHGAKAGLCHLQGAGATREAFLKAAAEADGIVTVCHGRGGDADAPPGLLLADGWLDAAEIASCRTSARLVLLLGCWGYSNRAAQDTQAASVAAAFAQAGAEYVVASLWEQPLDQVAPLLAHFIAPETLKDPAAALTAMQRAALAEGTLYSGWAGLVCLRAAASPRRGILGWITGGGS